MTVQEIEAAIAKLPPHQVQELAAWFCEHHHQLWDRQIEQDLAAGRLDAILSEVEKEYQSGQAKPL